MRHAETRHFFLQHNFGTANRSEDETNKKQEAKNHGGRLG
jgi:hypothetical protein